MLIDSVQNVLRLYDEGHFGMEYDGSAAEAMMVLRQSLDNATQDNLCVIRYNGTEVVYDLEEGKELTAIEWEERLPPWVRLKGILAALRAILEVPETHSILSHTVTLVRRYKKMWNDPMVQETIFHAGAQDRG